MLEDAKDERAVAFYRHYGFMSLVSQPRALFLPVATAEKIFLEALTCNISAFAGLWERVIDQRISARYE